MLRASRVVVAGAALSAVALLVPAAASAHVGVDQDEIVAGESTTLVFSVGHGCEGSPTTSMNFQVPEGVVNAQPFVKPGWSIETERAALAEPVESAHGDPQTDRVSVITFTAEEGSALPNEFRDTFSLRFTAPEQPGELFFKVVQGCETGENAWIEEWDGTGTEPDHPAPSVQVVAAADAPATDGTSVEETPATVAAVDVGSNDDDDDDDSSNGLAIAALVVGVLGLGAGGTALVRSRKPTPPAA